MHACIQLFVVPQLPKVSLIGLNNHVPMGDFAAAKKMVELGAEHKDEFQLTNVLRVGHKQGDAPRDIVLQLFFTDRQNSDSDEDSDDDEDDDE